MLVVFTEEAAFQKGTGLSVGTDDIFGTVHLTSAGEKQGIQRRTFLRIHMIMSQEPFKTLQGKRTLQKDHLFMIQIYMVKGIMILVADPEKFRKIPGYLEGIVVKAFVDHDLVNICGKVKISKIHGRDITVRFCKQSAENGISGIFPILVQSTYGSSLFFDLFFYSEDGIFQFVLINRFGQIKIYPVFDGGLCVGKIRISA